MWFVFYVFGFNYFVVGGVEGIGYCGVDFGGVGYFLGDVVGVCGGVVVVGDWYWIILIDVVVGVDWVVVEVVVFMGVFVVVVVGVDVVVFFVLEWLYGVLWVCYE